LHAHGRAPGQHFCPASPPRRRAADDEDWAPSPSAAQPLQHRLPHRGTRLHPPHDANDDDEEEAEEDIPLAQRRLALSARPPAAAAAAAAAGPRRWAPDLPQEVLQVVLTHACAHGAVPAAAVASCVSRSWRRAVAANPALWAAVDLSAARRPTDAAVAAHGAPRWAALRRLSLSGCTKLSDATLHAVAGACPLLQCLDLRGCSTFTPNGLSAALRIMLTRPLAPNSAPLRDIDLSLTEFKPKSSGLDSVVRALLHDQAAGPGGPCLERLILEGCPTLSHQGLRAACDAAAATASRSLGSLRELSLAGSGGLHPVFFINIERLQFASPLLQSLDLRGLCVINGWSFNAAPSALPGGAVASFAALRVLRVGDTPYAMSDSILQPKSNVTTACLARLLAGATGLEELDLSRCRVTAEGVVAALRASPALRSLTLSRAAAATDELLCRRARAARRRRAPPPSPASASAARANPSRAAPLPLSAASAVSP
jgi:hypothetical protein